MTVDLRVRFWGVRGAFPVPGSNTLRYGGNTACVEVRYGDRLLILDAGTGLRELGNALLREDAPLDADLFLTHAHLGNIMGLLAFAPLARARNRLRLWAPPPNGTEDWLSAVMRPPYVPIPLEHMGASVERRMMTPSNTHDLDAGVCITAQEFGPTGTAVGLRVDLEEASLVYLPTFASDQADTHALVAFAQRTRLLICGGSAQQAVALATAAKAERLVLIHHAPEQTDKVLDAVGWDAATALPGTEVASEGLVLRL